MTKRIKRDYGEFHVAKRRNSWRVKVRLPKTADGKRPEKSFSAPSKVEALAKAKEFKRTQDLGLNLESGEQLLSAWLPSWLDAHCTTQSLQNSSKIAYQGMVKGICQVLPTVSVKDLKPAHLDKLLQTDEGQVSSKKVRQYRLLKSAIRDAEIRGLIIRSPFIMHKQPRARRAKEARFLETSEVQSILETAEGKRIEPLLRFLLATGCRIGEALALTLDDLDLDSPVPSVIIRRSVRTQESAPVFSDVKTRNGRRNIELSPAVADMLQRHITSLQAESLIRGRWENNGLLFPSMAGTVWFARNVSGMFQKILKTAGLADTGITLHSMRHSHASHAIAQGESIFVLSRRLGHSSSTLTMDLYSHLLRGSQSVSAAAFDAIMVIKES